MSSSAVWTRSSSAHAPSNSPSLQSSQVAAHDNVPNEFMSERSPQLPSLLPPELGSLTDEVVVTLTSSIPITSDLPLSAGFPVSNGGITLSASLPLDGGDATPSDALSAPIGSSAPFVLPTIDSTVTDILSTIDSTVTDILSTIDSTVTEILSTIDSSVLGALPTTDYPISDIPPTTETIVSTILPTIVTYPSLDLPTVTIGLPQQTITVDLPSITSAMISTFTQDSATISPASIAGLPTAPLSQITAMPSPGTQLSWGIQFSSVPETISASGSFSLSQLTSALSASITSTPVLSPSTVTHADLSNNVTTSTTLSSVLSTPLSSSTLPSQSSSPGTTDNGARITSTGDHKSPASKPTASTNGSEFIKKPGAIAGTVTAVGIVVAALAVGIIVLIRMRRRRGSQRLPLQDPDEESGSMLRRNSSNDGISPGPPFEQAQPTDPFAGPSRIPVNYQPLDMVEVPRSNLSDHTPAPVGDLPTSPVDLVDPYGPNTMEDTHAKKSEPYPTSTHSIPGSARPESVVFPRDPYTSDPSIRGALDYILSDEDLSTVREDEEDSRSLLNSGPYGTRPAGPSG